MTLREGTLYPGRGAKNADRHSGRAAGSREVRHMVKRLALISGLAAMLVVGLAIAQTPFGGDDGGFITSDKGFVKCENSVAKSLGKAAACILRCHKKRASGVFADDAAEDDCETTPASSSATRLGNPGSSPTIPPRTTARRT